MCYPHVIILHIHIENQLTSDINNGKLYFFLSVFNPFSDRVARTIHGFVGPRYPRGRCQRIIGFHYLPESITGSSLILALPEEDDTYTITLFCDGYEHSIDQKSKSSDFPQQDIYMFYIPPSCLSSQTGSSTSRMTIKAGSKGCKNELFTRIIPWLKTWVVTL